jgi:hypothetical protein
MALPFYLAMTAGELQEKESLPRHLAYMACHFSPYGTGLTNFPKELPADSILIVNDRTPLRGHDPELIVRQLTDMAESRNLRGILLDLQRPGYKEAAELAAYLVKRLPCPVIVSEAYAADLSCPIFLSPCPPDVALAEYIQPWHNREIWLETAMDGLELTLTESGVARTSLPYPEAHCREFGDGTLHCHYHMELESNTARFTLRRTREDINTLLTEAENLGITAAVGLWQEFG